MVNPLTQKRLNTSKLPQDKSAGTPPVAEEWEGDNNPYRGIESHGVRPTVEPEPVPGYDGTHLATYTEKKEPPDPIPVIVVTEGGREFKDWQVRREYASGQANRILPRSEHRTSAKVHNLGTITVWVGPDSNVANWTGYPLPPNGDLEFPGEREVWAVSDDLTTQVPLAIFVQLVVKQT